MVAFTKATRGARTFADLERAVHKGLDGKGLMISWNLIKVGFSAERPGSTRQKSCGFLSAIRSS